MDVSVIESRHFYRNIWLLCGGIYTVIIVLGSLLKVPSVDVGMQHHDKLIHFLAYFILVGWFVQLYRQNSSRFLIVLLAIGLGLLLEFLQGMISYRSFDWIDAIANTLGAMSAYLLSGTGFASLLVVFDNKLYQLIHQPD